MHVELELSERKLELEVDELKDLDDMDLDTLLWNLSHLDDCGEE